MAGDTSEQLRKKIEQFIKITNVDYEDQTDRVRQKSSVIEWQFRVAGKVVISKNVNREDRIHLSVTMAFPPKEAALFVFKNPPFAKAVMQISQICTICGIGHQWIRGGRSEGGGDGGGDGRVGNNNSNNGGSGNSSSNSNSDSESVMGLSMSTHVDVEVLSRASFHDAWANLSRVAGHVQKILRAEFSGLLQHHNGGQQDQTQEKSMYG